MISKPFNDISETDVLALQMAGVQEGKTIEYKRDIPGTRDEDKREFLADMSSFANTEGGDILFGVDEYQGVIKDILGVALPDFDAEMLRLDNLIRDGIDPRITLFFRALTCTNKKLLLVRVEKSWNGPHRVVFRGHDKFYARTSAGKFPLDVTQLKTAFLHSATLTEEISGFRLDRIVDIANNRGPITLEKGPRLALHIIPLGALSGQIQIDMGTLSDNLNGHQSWNASSWNGKITFDGFLLNRASPRNGSITSAYSHFYRNGILEAVTTSLLEGGRNADGMNRLIPHQSLEKNTVEYLTRCFEALESLNVSPPFSVSLSLIGVTGLRMARSFYDLDAGNEIREQNLIIPGAIVQSFSFSPTQLLRPMFDRIWNACGFHKSENFDLEGNWAPAHN